MSNGSSYWEIVEKMWGETAAKAVHWVFQAMFLAGVAIGVIMVTYQIFNQAIKLHNEQDMAWKSCFSTAAKSMLKFIILVCVAGIAIPLMWEFLFPFLVSLGFDPDKPKAMLNLANCINYV